MFPGPMPVDGMAVNSTRAALTSQVSVTLRPVLVPP
jgi:hypothetical protein